ncbi:hypothetical protein M5D96_011649, partial [Drosophila gunungcola]
MMSSVENVLVMFLDVLLNITDMSRFRLSSLLFAYIFIWLAIKKTFKAIYTLCS